MEFYSCLAVFCLLLGYSGLAQGKVSDACHGSKTLNETYNVLTCEAGTQICITEVRAYTNQGCGNLQYSTPIPPECCRHDPNECSEVIDSAGLQNICDGRTQCRVLSPMTSVITTPCPVGFSILSTVRSITYSCSSAGSCSETAPDTTTTTRSFSRSSTTTTTTTTRSPIRSPTAIAAPKTIRGNNPAGSGSENDPFTTTGTLANKNSAKITPTKEANDNRPADTPSSTTQLNDSPASSTTVDYTGVIIGCVVAIIVLVIGIVAFIFLSRRKKATPRKMSQPGDKPAYLNPSISTMPAISLTNDPYPNLPIAPSAPPPNRVSYLSAHDQPPNNTSYINLNRDGGYVEPQANVSIAGDIPLNEEAEYTEAF